MSEWVDVWEAEDFRNAYRNWLEERMRARRYSILFDVMHDTPFEWNEKELPRDGDRAMDGKFLRVRFSEEYGKELLEEEMDDPCSFLEFLVALSYSIDDEIMYDAENPEQAADWFWEIMSNMKLDKYDNDTMSRDGILAFYAVGEILDMVMKRRYDYNGYPGMFPLSKPEADQRHVEIWYQANAYFIEKCFEDGI